MNKIKGLTLAMVFCFVFAVAVHAVEEIKDEGEGQMIAEEGTPLKKEEPPVEKSDTSDWGVTRSARAIFQGLEEGSPISGRVDLVQTGGGLQTVISVSNVTPGNHGIHIHEGGNCNDIGGHFNPAKAPHGWLARDGAEKAHAGDIGNVKVQDNGQGSLSIFLPGLSLTEETNNVVGRTVVLTADEDDFSRPDGNAGAPIACGVIIMNN